MGDLETNKIYFDLQISGNSPETEIWLGDDAGYLVQKETGVLRTRLIPGDYVVEFGLGTPCYPIPLQQDSSFTQNEIEAGPSCERPQLRFLDESFPIEADEG